MHGMFVRFSIDYACIRTTYANIDVQFYSLLFHGTKKKRMERKRERERERERERDSRADSLLEQMTV